MKKPIPVKEIPEVNEDALTERLQAQREQFENELSAEKNARGRLENQLREREETVRQYEEKLRLHEMENKARARLRERELPDALLPVLRLDSEETLDETLLLAESAFREAVESGVRARLRPEPLPYPAKAGAPARLSYRQAAQLYCSDRTAYDKKFGGKSSCP